MCHKDIYIHLLITDFAASFHTKWHTRSVSMVDTSGNEQKYYGLKQTRISYNFQVTYKLHKNNYSNEYSCHLQVVLDNIICLFIIYLVM